MLRFFGVQCVGKNHIAVLVQVRLGGGIARRKSRHMFISDFNIVLHGSPVDFPCSIPKTNAIKFEGLFGMHVELKAPGGGLKAQTREKGCGTRKLRC